MSTLDTSKIKQVPLKTSEYFQEENTKTQIYLHHTAGNASGVSVMNDWNSDSRGRIGTCVAISGPSARGSYDGEIVQGFSSKHWAYHLGVKQEVFRSYKIPWRNLDQSSIGIEICNWGQLELKNGKFYNYVNGEVNWTNVTTLEKPYKGHKHFHKYSDAQIESVRQLLLYWKDVYKIDITFDYNKMFTVNTEALSGKNGLYSHNSVRKDKIDIYPCPRMIAMLKSL